MYFGQDAGSGPRLTQKEEDLLLKNLHVFMEGFRLLEQNESKAGENPENEDEKLFFIKKTQNNLVVWGKQNSLDDSSVKWIEKHVHLFFTSFRIV